MLLRYKPTKRHSSIFNIAFIIKHIYPSSVHMAYVDNKCFSFEEMLV